MKNTLEGSKLFPIIAWTTFLLFASLTFWLATELQQSAAYLGDKVQDNVSALDEA
jgi:hypothetical protein